MKTLKPGLFIDNIGSIETITILKLLKLLKLLSNDIKLVCEIKLSEWVKSESLSGSSSLNNRNNRKKLNI